MNATSSTVRDAAQRLSVDGQSVVRDALLSQILGGIPHVVLIQAPAGFGKSTLMRQIANEGRWPEARRGWLSLDESHNDISRLVRDFESLVSLVTSESAGGNAREKSRRPSRSPINALVSRLGEAGDQVALFFDDFQNLSDDRALSFFKRLLERVPDTVSVFISSRTTPEIGLARLLINGQLLHLSAEDLRFSRTELDGFFDYYGGAKLSEQELSAIYSRTEGWPAACQLYRLSLSKAEVRASLSELQRFNPRQLAEYLTDNVLALQSTDVQHFLLDTSILRRLSGPLCDSVLDRTGSASLLRQLESSGLFTRSFDSDDGRFAYHALFSKFLSDQLRERDPQRATRIHARAAEWFGDNHLYEEAIHHAIHAGELVAAAKYLDEWSTELVMSGNHATVTRWYDELPYDELQRHPSLVVKAAWAIVFRRETERLDEISALLEHQLEEYGESLLDSQRVIRAMIASVRSDTEEALHWLDDVDLEEAEVEGFSGFERGAAANLKGLIAMTAGRLEEARELLLLGRAHSQRVGATFSLDYSLSTSAVNLAVQGRVTDALSLLQNEPRRERSRARNSVVSAPYAACYASLLYEANRIDESKRVFDHYHDAIADAALLDYLAIAFISRARIYDLDRERGMGSSLLEEAESIAHRSGWQRLARSVAWERVRRALLAGEAHRAHTIASRIRGRGPASCIDGWLPFSDDIEGDTIGQIRLAIHQGRSSEVFPALSAELSSAVYYGRIRRKIRLLTLVSLAHHMDGAAKPAHRNLQQALELAWQGGFVRIMIDEGPIVTQLIHEAYRLRLEGDQSLPGSVQPRGEVPTEYLKSLLEAAGVNGASLGGSTQSASRVPWEPLSEREEQILSLLASGLTNQQIAESVFVSQNTVKFHLKNIYSKLGVKSRLQAISVGRDAGLL